MKTFGIGWALACALLAGCQASSSHNFAQPTPVMPDGSTAHSLTTQETADIQNGVRGFLADPGSAIFSGQTRAVRSGNGEVTVCGKVNSKDRQGSYIGESPYIAKLRDGAVVDTITVGPDADIVAAMCAKAGIPV